MQDELERDPISVLVSGKPGTQTEALSVSEYEKLRTCLEFSRSDSKELRAIAESIGSCADPERRSLGWFLSWLMNELGDYLDQIQGLLTRPGVNPPLSLFGPNYSDAEFDEPVSLAAFLTVLRAGGWFARWLDIQVRCFADREHNPRPTPLQMMGLLTLEAAAFEEKVVNARAVLQNHWDALGFPGLTPPDPAAYEKLHVPAPRPEKKEPTRYQLTVVEDGEVKDPANITRAELLALKKHLTAMRARTARGRKKAA
jgi:hypothetical protein